LAYYHEGKRFDVTSDHITSALKLAPKALEYPIIKGIPIECINTHLLLSGSANALALAGYSDTQIQKMGRWSGATFKDYVWKDFAYFSSGMSQDMKQKFRFVNVSGNVFSDIMDACINAEYLTPLPLLLAVMCKSLSLDLLSSGLATTTVLSNDAISNWLTVYPQDTAPIGWYEPGTSVHSLSLSIC
jgi:hypothetical protein